MNKYLLCVVVLLLFAASHVQAQTQIEKRNVGDKGAWDKSRDRSNPEYESDFPWVPRVAAYEAYTKYKAGRAFIFHGGGAKFEERHILGAYNLDVKNREPVLRKFPKEGIEIYTYCY